MATEKFERAEQAFLRKKNSVPQFENIPLNLQQGMIRYTNCPPGTVNQICAIWRKSTTYGNTLVVDPSYKQDMNDIILACPVPLGRILYGDGFQVDTWDGKIEECLHNQWLDS